jgi:chromosome segregation ATPase
VADFIAFNYIKWFSRTENERTDFMKRIHLAAYNGNHELPNEDLRECLGLRLRILPTDILKVQNLQSELKTLRKSYENLKHEKNRINKKLKTITNEKHELQEKYDRLLSQTLDSVNKDTIKS